MSDRRIRLPQDVYDTIKVMAGKTGKKETQVIGEILKEAMDEEGTSLREFMEDMVDDAKVSTGRRPVTRRTYQPQERKIDPLDRFMERIEKILTVRLMMSMMNDSGGMMGGGSSSSLTPEEKALLFGRRGVKYPLGTSDDKLSPKDMIDQLTLLKLVESMGTGSGKEDPETKRLLSEIRLELVKGTKTPEVDRTKELMDRVVLLKSVGASDEAKVAQNQLLTYLREQDKTAKNISDSVDKKMDDLQKQVFNTQVGFIQSEKDRIEREFNEYRMNPPKSDIETALEMWEKSKTSPLLRKALEAGAGIDTKKKTSVSDFVEAAKTLGLDKIVDGVKNWLSSSEAKTITTRKIPLPPEMNAEEVEALKKLNLDETSDPELDVIRRQAEEAVRQSGAEAVIIGRPEKTKKNLESSDLEESEEEVDESDD